jgi:hypothetical protein
VDHSVDGILHQSVFCGILTLMPPPESHDYAILYSLFTSAITGLDCGSKCAPFNGNGVPFCCDTDHAIPTAYLAEWEYLCKNSNQWHLWEGDQTSEVVHLKHQVPPGQVLLTCLGHKLCLRNSRSIACRAFPFFPYISQQKEFLGLSYYSEYEERCWVISNLDRILPEYIAEFIATFDILLKLEPQEVETFFYHSMMMRRIYGRRHRTIPVIHRNGCLYQVTPKNGTLRRVMLDKLPKYGPYQITDRLLFPGEDKEKG